MTRPPVATVYLLDGLRGTVADFEARGWAEVRLDDGRVLSVPASLLERSDDGVYLLELSAADLPPAADGDDQTREAAGGVIIPVLREEAVIGRRKVVTGKTTVRKTVRSAEQVVDLPTYRDEVEVRRVPVDRFVESPIPIREEGDTTIISLLEEVLVVEKRLKVREEVHITRRRTEHHRSQSVTLRAEDVTVERAEAGAATS